MQQSKMMFQKTKYDFDMTSVKTLNTV